MRLGQTSIIYFISKVVGSLLGFLATVYITRTLGETVFGYYSLTLNLALWLALIGNVGLTGAIVKRVSEGEDKSEFVTSGLLFASLMFLTASAGAILFRNQIEAYVGAPVAGFIVLLVFAFLFRGLAFSALKGHHLVHIYAPLTTLKVGIRGIAQILAVFLGFGLAGILTGYAIGGIIVGIIGLFVIRFRPTFPSKFHFIRLYDYAKFSWLGNVRGRAFSSVDILVLGAFVQTGLVGIYTAAWTISEFLNLFGEGISNTLFPEMSKIAGEQGVQAVGKLTEDALAFAGLILVPGLVGGAVISDLLLRVFGENFVQGSTILIILVAALLIYTYVKQLLNTLNAVDRPDLAFRANGAFLVTNIFLNVLFVWQFGWVGAAVATALSATIGLVLAFNYTRKIIDFAVPYGEIVRQWIAALIMGGIVYAVRSATEPTTLAIYNEVFVLLLVTVGSAVYFAVLLVISEKFRSTAHRNLPFKV